MKSATLRSLSLLGLLSTLLFAGCDKDDPVTPQPLPPSLTFETATVNVPAEGGPAQMKYTIENPVEGATVTAKCADSWISQINATTDGVISFVVAANETTEAREAVIEVSYADIEPTPTFKVKQGAPNAKPEITFAQESVSVPAEGGPAQMKYTIENPVKDAAISAQCDAAWISQINTETNGVISFVVAANETAEAREAVIEVSYADLTPAPSFKVKQGAPDAQPEIAFAQESVDVAAEGGPAQMGYTIENPIKDATLQATCAESWVSNLSTATEGLITFEVAANETTEAREAVVKVQYGDIQQFGQFTIKQAGKQVVEEAFTLSVSDITTTGFSLSVSPKDAAMSYLLNVIPTSESVDISSDEALYQYDIEFYEDLSYGLGWQSAAHDDLKWGSISNQAVESLKPDTEYLIYVYGVSSETIERLTPVTRKIVKTLAPQMIEADFDLQITSVDGLNLTATVTANGYDGYFVAKLYSNLAGDPEATVLEKISEEWVDNVRMYGWIGFTTDMILNTYANKGSKEIQEELDPNTQYYLYVFAVDGEAVRCSDITFTTFTTNDTTVQQ